MWPFRKKLRQRRLEVRRNMPAALSAWAWLRHPGAGASLFIAGGFFLGACLLLLWPLEPLPYRPGQYVSQDIRSRVDFSFLLEKEKADKINSALRSRPAMLRLDPKLLEEITTGLLALPAAQVKAASQPAQAWEGGPDYEKQAKQLGNDLERVCFIGLPQWDSFVTDAYINYLQGGRRLDVGLLVPLNKPDRVDGELDRLVKDFSAPARSAVKEYLRSRLLPDRPLYVYDEKAREAFVEEEVRHINAYPPARTYKVGEVLVYASDAHGLANDDLRVLRQEHENYVEGLRLRQGPLYSWGRLVGRSVLPLLATIGLCCYIVTCRRPLTGDHAAAAGLAALGLITLGLTRLLISGLGLHPYSAVAPVIGAGLILAIVHGRGFALAVGGYLALLVLLQLRGDVPLGAVLLVGAAGAVVRLTEVRTRSRLIEMGAIAAVCVVLVVFADSVARSVPRKFALAEALWSGGFALLAGFVIQGLLPLLERLFHIATSMTLLEWCDASKPLLRRLAMECPGTYNHSLQLGTIGEAAAEAVGARGLLARVGTYYHDIGKINKPDYFTENVGGRTSRHDKLSPAMSLLILIGHVKDGIEMAREYGLPRVLHEFIATHHGTTLIQSFYQAAAEQRRAESDRDPDDVEFRYPGPKPASKEAAILMLADACESSARAMLEPTAGQIESQVHTMITRRLMDGQLDECDLTLREVSVVEESIAKSLCSIYHSRITYPALSGQKPAASEAFNGPRPQ
ncbi:MAG: HDIG domain-containing protein [Planctomycetota bacterium]|nr:HDIG domain-containing protein [Planctomycetota bacterium]